MELQFVALSKCRDKDKLWVGGMFGFQLCYLEVSESSKHVDLEGCITPQAQPTLLEKSSRINNS